LKTKIKNFQIIKSAELEFEPGITAIVGDSNNGKSSIIRAIESAINNKGGSGFINYDSDCCDVVIEDNGHKIKWHKDRASRKSYYDIDGKKLNKIGQKQLDEVGDLLNMSEIEINNDRFRLNFWKQMDFPFLVGKTAYQLFDFISRSEEQELMQELRDRSTEEYKVLKKDIDTLESQIDMITKDTTTIEEEIENLEKFESYDLDRLEALLGIYHILSEDIESYEDLCGDTQTYKEEKSLIEKQIKSLDKLFNSIDTLYSFREEIEPLILSLESKLEDKDRASEGIKVLVSKELDVKNKITAIEGILEKIKELSGQAESLEDLLGQISFEKQAVLNEKKHITLIEEQISEIVEELEEFKVCPLCGGSLEGDECVE
jgi:exonuclease SbcC